MSIEESIAETSEPSTEIPRSRVYGFVDGFNLYHAMQCFRPAVPVDDPDRYQKYKWLCLTSLLQRFLLPHTESLVGVEYFTAYPNWDGSDAKRLRHQQYVAAQRQMGVNVTFGEFKPKIARCMSECQKEFETFVEKQTDINIAVSLINLADQYDKAILLTGDSDQVPTIELLRRLYPRKKFAVLVPIGRGAKELQKVCHEKFKMTEKHLASSQLPNPIKVTVNGTPNGAFIVKPPIWP